MISEDDSGASTTELHVEEDNELPIIQLCGLVEEFSYGNSALKTETEMFEKYYNKLESRDQRTSRMSEIKISGAEFAQLRGRRKTRSRIGSDRVTSLSVHQKCELVQKELEDTKNELRHLRANAERDLQYHEAIIEEAEIRWTEIQRAAHEFKTDILKTISKKKGSILATQRLLKYMEDMNRRRDNMKDKLRLKNVSLKAQREKMLLQLRQEEVGEALHDVDFQQLKFKNAQFLETIEAWNQELIQLKPTSGSTLQILHTHKTRLHRALEVSVSLEKEISLRNELLKKLERETLQVEEDRAKAEALNKQLRKQLSEFRVPPVMLYVKQKAINGDLEKTIKMWERKVEIAEMSLKGYRKAWNKMKTTNEQLLAICHPGK